MTNESCLMLEAEKIWLSLLACVINNLPDFVSDGIDRETALCEMTMTCHTAVPVINPRLYQIETTSRCNLLCPFCPRTIDLVKHGQRDLNAVMSLEKFEGILDRMPWVKSLELFHFGEPFMHKDFEKYVSACRQREIYSVVASNLLPATPAKLDAVFAAGLDFLVMDIDSLDPERYAAARVNGDLARLREIVVYILSKPKLARPYCVAQTIQLDDKPEYGEQEFLAWTGGLPVDEIRYKFIDSFRATVCIKGQLGPNDLCREPFYGFTVHVNGNVVPCDRDWAGENVMGNIFEEDPLAIWNGEKYRAFRAKMCSSEKPHMCRNCPEGKMVNLRSQQLVQVNMFKGAEIYHA